ncbi:hypothetical protein DDB_G0293212 [Dictyostelium discoideum AX4]|uniref:ATP-dependent DNA helicase n=1 Tax=Dictyostelium discoideum TaxID=44689 RepID=Q54C21_DICDI|nr:hypothetical protein DDB_G0293212 [Dictyostelium discoideum AX4]EAL60805.1 hypothetical protein DDB_G0293212 [Dictyostelium discoideum AX4]|eukprot:XP_629245.1 hypothetical protein DDB_G0293212 [Dictyostelium discoideum AX4]
MYNSGNNGKEIDYIDLCNDDEIDLVGVNSLPKSNVNSIKNHSIITSSTITSMNSTIPKSPQKMNSNNSNNNNNNTETTTTTTTSTTTNTNITKPTVNHLKPSTPKRPKTNKNDFPSKKTKSSAIDLFDDVIPFEDAMELLKNSFELKYGIPNNNNNNSNNNNNNNKTTQLFENIEHKRESLNKEQLEILDNVLNGKNIFFTGPGGTGKSYLLHVMIKELSKRGIRSFVTATTGIAALNIGGTTIHSFAGIRLGNQPFKFLLEAAYGKKNNWKSCEVLIVDEISMLDGDLFDNLEKIARIIRLKSNLKYGYKKKIEYPDPSKLPWGGIQVVLSGDFYQLPPVPSPPPDAHFTRDDLSLVKKRTHCFDAESWDSSIDIIIPLTQIFRQKDQHFSEMLSRIRVGNIDDKILQELRKCDKPLVTDNGIQPTILYTTNNKVEEMNQKYLEDINREQFEFIALDRNANQENIQDQKKINHLQSIFENSRKSCLAASRFNLKSGAQVMLVRNISPTLVNGSRGVVIGFMNQSPDEQTKLIQFLQEQPMLETRQREKMIEQFKSSAIYLKGQRHRYLPVVKFMNDELEVIKPENYSVFYDNGERIYRIQIPLKLAWAVTFHKIQGVTLDCAQISLNKVFEHGQSYVALSRIKSLEGLQIVGDFSKNCFKIDKKVSDFYQNLNLNSKINQTKKSLPPLEDSDSLIESLRNKNDNNNNNNNLNDIINDNNNIIKDNIQYNNQNNNNNNNNQNNNQNNDNKNIPIPPIQKLEEKQQALFDSTIPIYFLCPISQKIMEHPYVAPDGYTFERSSILEWFDKRGAISFVTKRPFSTSAILIPNRNLKAQIQEWKNSHPPL